MRIFTIILVALAAYIPTAVVSSSAVAETVSKPAHMDPEVKLVDDYNNFFFDQAFNGTPESLKAGLSQFITDKTILHEPASMPQGGTMVGPDGWVRLIKIAKPIYATKEVAALMDLSAPTYYRSGNVVFREMTMSFKPSPKAPEPFSMEIVEKYTVSNGRISEIRSYEFDSASLRERLVALGVVPPREQK